MKIKNLSPRLIRLGRKKSKVKNKVLKFIVRNSYFGVHNSLGYTLIELIAVTTVLVIFSSVIATMMAFTLRGANKAKTANVVSQSGNYALSVITTALIGSKYDSGDTTHGVSNTVSDPGTCQISPAVAVPGAILRVDQSDGALLTFTCDRASTPHKLVMRADYDPPTLDIVKNLTDTSQVKLGSACSFTCTKVDNFSPPLITIQFSLQEKDTTALFESIFSSNFRTSVSLRNYQ